jgi:hypothetical protein
VTDSESWGQFTKWMRVLDKIESCPWHHDEPDRRFDEPRWVQPDAAMVAEYGDGATVFATVLAETMEIDAVLVKHFTEDHSLLDWVAEVGRLNMKVAALADRDAEIRDLLARMSELATEKPR